MLLACLSVDVFHIQATVLKFKKVRAMKAHPSASSNVHLDEWRFAYLFIVCLTQIDSTYSAYNDDGTRSSNRRLKMIAAPAGSNTEFRSTCARRRGRRIRKTRGIRCFRHVSPHCVLLPPATRRLKLTHNHFLAYFPFCKPGISNRVWLVIIPATPRCLETGNSICFLWDRQHSTDFWSCWSWMPPF
jgi:hypothetical protein